MAGDRKIVTAEQAFKWLDVLELSGLVEESTLLDILAVQAGLVAYKLDTLAERLIEYGLNGDSDQAEWAETVGRAIGGMCEFITQEVCLSLLPIAYTFQPLAEVEGNQEPQPAKETVQQPYKRRKRRPLLAAD